MIDHYNLQFLCKAFYEVFRTVNYGRKKFYEIETRSSILLDALPTNKILSLMRKLFKSLERFSNFFTSDNFPT